MPWRTIWVPTDKFMSWDGVYIYYMYSDDEYDNGRLAYWYGLRDDCEWGDEDVFNIREIAKALGIKNPNAIENEHQYIIRRGIEAGIITPDKIILPNET
jgi:hypothetical protein